MRNTHSIQDTLSRLTHLPSPHLCIRLLRKLRDLGFDSSDQQLAMALGRPLEEIEAWMGGADPVDDDVIMKARGIATQRGLEIE